MTRKLTQLSGFPEFANGYLRAVTRKFSRLIINIKSCCDMPMQDTWACPRCGQTADEHYEDGRCLTEPRLGAWLVTTITSIAKVVGFLFLGAIILFALRWAYTEFWIGQHCTMVLGARVCR